jgi:hypothetical protein
MNLSCTNPKKKKKEKKKERKKRRKPNYYLILGLETMLLVNCNDGYSYGNYGGN